MKTVRRPPYPKWNPGYFPCSSLTTLPLSSRRPSVSFGGFGLKTMFQLIPGKDYKVVGEPLDTGSATALAEQDRYQFQYWAMSLLEALPRENKKKGADRGIDGLVYFIDGPRQATQRAVVQVKSGRVSSPQIRDLKGVLEREKAALGLLITLQEPTRDMRDGSGQRRLLSLHHLEKRLPKDPDSDSG